MAEGKDAVRQQRTISQGDPPQGTRGPLHLDKLGAGALGLLGFSIAVFQGLAAGNAAGDILARALLALAALMLIGGAAGAILQRIISEQRAKAEAELAAQREAAAARLAQAARAETDDAANQESTPSEQVENEDFVPIGPAQEAERPET